MTTRFCLLKTTLEFIQGSGVARLQDDTNLVEVLRDQVTALKIIKSIKKAITT